MQAGSAEKVAVIVQALPSELRLFRAYASGLTNGALNVCVVPPQLLDTVNVPVAGALTKEMEPDTE